MRSVAVSGLFRCVVDCVRDVLGRGKESYLEQSTDEMGIYRAAGLEQFVSAFCVECGKVYLVTEFQVTCMVRF